MDFPTYSVSGVLAPASRRRSTNGLISEQPQSKTTKNTTGANFSLDNLKNSTKLEYNCNEYIGKKKKMQTENDKKHYS